MKGLRLLGRLRILQRSAGRVAKTLPFYPRIRSEYRSVLESVGAEKLKAALAEARDSRIHSDQEKYLQRRHIIAGVARGVLLGLHRSRPLRILDLGCGAGWFLLACRHWGHEAVGLDLDVFELYNRLIQALDIHRHVHRIEPQSPLPDIGRFDLVTAFYPMFDSAWMRVDGSVHFTRWEASDWAFFLEDLRSRVLRPDGRVYLKLNHRLSEESDVHGLFCSAPGFESRCIDQSNFEFVVRQSR